MASGVVRRSLTRLWSLVLVLAALAGIAVAITGPPPSALAQAPVDADGHAHQREHVRNGRLPITDLVPVAGIELAPAAAEAFGAMRAAAAREGGVIEVTDGYRTFDQQVRLWREKPDLAATPGTSLHGRGIAVDLDTRVTDFAWLRANAADYGWIHPAWAQPDGSKPEPWHWEYVGSDVAGGAGAPPPSTGAEEPSTPRVEVDELIASVRLEPHGAPAGSWFDVHEGLEGLRDGARHYPATALPGEDGNVAIAGYQRRGAGPLAGVDELDVGDRIRVRAPGGDEQVHTVFRLADLGEDEGWAVGPDPFDDGSTHLLTLTTANGADGLTVVWAR